MCGIVGFNGKDSNKLTKMLTSIKHRGPDDSGRFEDEKISLGHVRLSIVDLTSLGHQPMQFESLEMVFNGEVYNFKEIRQELILLGYTFKSDTDSEVILKSYHAWGMKAIDKFIGMFAIAIYDKSDDSLVLIRDRVGVKPLYYYHHEEKFIFASELRAIQHHLDDFNIDTKALSEYMRFGYISSNLSILKNCQKLPAGHSLKYFLNENRLQIKEYWSILPFFKLEKFKKTEEELIDELEALLIDAFKYRMVSDVPVGVFLSGGIDSSIVAAILQKHHGDIHTFTIGFKEEKYNEANYAKEIAEYLGTNHTEKILGVEEAKEVLKDYVKIYDEPFADSSAIPTTMVCRVAKDAGVKVVLSADGGDEVFCGYSRYWESDKLGKKIFLMPFFLRQIGVKFLNLFNHKIFLKIKKIQALIKHKKWEDFYVERVSYYRDDALKNILTTFEAYNPKVSLSDIPHLSNMEKMMLIDYHHYMVDDILTKVDRATMSVSIEGREPLLDHRIAEFMAQVPFKYKYKEGTSKYLLKKVLERYIPKEMIERPKMGFAIPLMEWFEEELNTLFKENLTQTKLEVHGLFKTSHIEQLNKEKNNLNKTNKLWFILVFQLWYKKYKRKEKKNA